MELTDLPQILDNMLSKQKDYPELVEYKSPAGPYWYHPDHPMCQDGAVLWEFPEDDDDSETDYKTSLKNDY